MDFRIAICDDDIHARMRILELLEGNLSKYVIDQYETGELLLKSKKKYDIIFLDIEMGEMNGLRIAKALRDEKRDDYIVFLTSHVELMSEAFKVKAFRFLCKPIQQHKFFEALREAEKEILDDEKIMITSEGDKHMLSQKDIIYIESLGDGSCIYTASRDYITNKPLKHWDELLDQSLFFKIHKSYILGLSYVKTIMQTDVELTVDDIKLPLARRKKADFQKAYIQFVKEHARQL